MLTVVYCECCKKRIAQYGEIQLSLFEHVCESFFSGDIFRVSKDIHSGTFGYFQMIRFLEMKGFVVTTEDSQDSIIVKPLGFDYFEDEDLKICCFCKSFAVE